MAERSHFTNLGPTIAALALIGCSSSSTKQAAAKTDTTTKVVAVGAAPGSPGCPATGLWAQCSILYRFERAGIAPHLDSTATVEEKTLSGGQSFVIKFGATSKLELFLYPDSASRVKDGAKLDRTKLVSATAPQTINRERTLIENANLIGLLTSLNDRLRERVSDALTAGAPQPPVPVVVK